MEGTPELRPRKRAGGNEEIRKRGDGDLSFREVEECQLP